MFGKRLQLARKKKGLTLDQLANIYNERFDGSLSKGTLSKYENGKQEPMISTVGNLASVLGVSVDFLIGDDIAEPLETEIETLYNQLDNEDKIELRGIIKGMLYADKYKKNKQHSRRYKQHDESRREFGYKTKVMFARFKWNIVFVFTIYFT